MRQYRHLTGGLDMDTSPQLVSPEDYIYAKNIAQGRSAKGDIGIIKNIKGTSALTMSSITDQYDECIGVVNDRAEKTAYYFFYNSNSDANHKIVSVKEGTVALVIKSDLLDFSATTQINGGFVVDNIIYYADGADPKAIDVTKWASGSTGAVKRDITLIKARPMLAPSFEKLDATTDDPDVVRNFAYQFAYQFMYETDQYSVLSPYSVLSNQGINTDTYQKIRIHVPIAAAQVTDSDTTSYARETVPETVSEIHIYSRIGNTGAWNKIKKIPRDGTDKFEVDYFDFYGNVAGVPLFERYTVPFDSVPLDVKTMELAKNRIFLGNYTDGYNTPSGIGLSATLSVKEFDSGNSQTKDLTSSYKIQKKKYTYNGSTFIGADEGAAWYGVLKGGEYFKITVEHGTATPYDPATYNGTDSLDTEVSATAITDDGYPAKPWEVDDFYYVDLITYEEQVYIYLNAGTSVSTWAGEKTFSANSSYRLGIVFSDFAGRVCGVYSPDDAQIDIPYKNYIFDAKIDWALDPLTAPQIPTWAESYSIVVTKNLKKSYFIDYHTSSIQYVKVAPDGTKTYDFDYTANVSYTSVDIAGLIAAGKGYEYLDGDRIILFFGANTAYDFPIRGLDGTEVMLDSVDVSDPLPDSTYKNIRFEIYRPKDDQFESLFYEVGEAYPLTENEGEKQFSQLNGQLQGDTVNVVRTRYKYTDDSWGTDPAYAQPTDALATDGTDLYRSISIDDTNPNASWDTDIGRGFIETDIGQVTKDKYIRFGGTFVQDTKTNALNEFDPTAEDMMPIENGGLQKLMLTSKVKGDGGIILGIGVTGTASIYVGETNMNMSQGTSFFITSSEVIGDIRPLRERNGTLNPESVLEHNGQVFWFDYVKKAFVRYSSNGLDQLSDNKMIKYFSAMSEAIVAGDKIITGVDPVDNVLFVTFETLASGYSADMKTVGLSLDTGRWISFYGFAPEAYTDIFGEMYMVDAATAYKHRGGTLYSIFLASSQDNTKFKVVFNDDMTNNKEWEVLVMSVLNSMLTWTDGEQVLNDTGLSITITNDLGQSTDILYDELDADESILYGTILRDSNSSGGIINGDDIVSRSIEVEFSTDLSTEMGVNFIGVIFEPSVGH